MRHGGKPNYDSRRPRSQRSIAADVRAYVDAVNQDLLDRIPLIAKVVLDVGCGTGALGAAYRRLNPRARVLGIEMDPGAAAIAAQRLDEVAIGDVEDDPLPFAPEGGIDCIIYGDVLEHLRDPWAVLHRHAEALNDGRRHPDLHPQSRALELRRAPAARHLGLRAAADCSTRRICAGSAWRRCAKGCEAAGPVPCDVHAAHVRRASRPPQFARQSRPRCAALGVDPARYADRAAPLQYVWRVRKTPRSAMTIAANMLAPVGGVSHVRIVYPLRAMATDPAS